MHNREAAREELSIILVDAYTEKKMNSEYNQDEFLDDFIYDRQPEAEVAEDEISLNGFTFELDRNVPQLGEYIGESGNLPARIRKIEVTNKTLSEISVEVTTARAEGATFRYSYKKLSESAYQGNVEQSGNTYTFTGLETKQTYEIRVELIKDGEVVDDDKIEVRLGELEEGSITFGTITWSAGTASVPVNTNTSYQLQYQINGTDEGSWTDISNNGSIQNIPNGSDVYARLFDGTSGSDHASITVEDNVNPTIKAINETEVTFDSIKIQVKAEDAESGIAKIEYSKDDGTSYTTGTSNTALEYEFTDLEQGTEYIIKVRVTDNANNISEQSKTISTQGEEFSDIYTETAQYTDSEGNTAWIPKGFAVGVSEGINKISGGLVITSAINSSHYSTGNEFVWIPVDDESLNEMYTVVETPVKLSGVTTTTSVYSKLRGTTGSTPNTTGNREPDLVTYHDTQSQYYEVLAGSAQEMADDMVAEYTSVYESIKKYDGFYIGRFELTGTVQNPTVQKGETVLTAKTAGNWYQLKKACTNIVTESEEYEAQSIMIYGNQWDEVMRWLESSGYNTSDSRSWGNYNNSTGNATEGSGTYRPSGYNEAWKANNIYDLAGNYYDWTQEADSTVYRILRGGNYVDSGSASPASDRGNSRPNNASSYHSCRPALYVAL